VFKINRRTDYSVRVMVALAKRPFGARLSTQAIQDEMLVPRAFLQRIIADLSKARLVLTYAGPNGGLQLARSPEAITLRDIWEAVEGPLLVSDCLKGCGECPLAEGCPVRGHWGQLQAQILQVLEAANLKKLVDEAIQISTGVSMLHPLEVKG